MKKMGSKYLSIHPLKGLNILNDDKIEWENFIPNEFKFISRNELLQFKNVKRNTDRFEHYSLLIDSIVSQEKQDPDSFLLLCLNTNESETHKKIAKDIISCYSIIVLVLTNFQNSFLHLDNFRINYSQTIIFNLQDFEKDRDFFGNPQETRYISFNCSFYREDLDKLTQFEYFRYYFDLILNRSEIKVLNSLNLISKAVLEYNTSSQQLFSISSIDVLLKMPRDSFEDLKKSVKKLLGDYLSEYYNYPVGFSTKHKPYDLFEERHDITHDGKQEITANRAHTSLRFAIYVLFFFCFRKNEPENIEKFKEIFDPLIFALYKYFSSTVQLEFNPNGLSEEIKINSLFESAAVYSILRSISFEDSVEIFFNISIANFPISKSDFVEQYKSRMSTDCEIIAKHVNDIKGDYAIMGIDKYKL